MYVMVTELAVIAIEVRVRAMQELDGENRHQRAHEWMVSDCEQQASHLVAGVAVVYDTCVLERRLSPEEAFTCQNPIRKLLA